MNAKQKDKMRMVLAVLAALLKEKETWQAHEAFAEAVRELSAAIHDVEKATQQQIAKDGAVDTKTEAAELLGRIAYEVAGAAFSCATRAGNTELAGRVDYPPSGIMHGGQTSIHARCLGILSAAREVAPALVRYGITPDRLELLNKRIEAFHRAQTEPRSEQSEGQVATSALADGLAQAGRELTDHIDRLIGQFEEGNPHLVAKYWAARQVVHLSGNADKDHKEGGTDEAQATPPPAAPQGPVVPKAA
jgi:hypothetical protein